MSTCCSNIAEIKLYWFLRARGCTQGGEEGRSPPAQIVQINCASISKKIKITLPTMFK